MKPPRTLSDLRPLDSFWYREIEYTLIQKLDKMAFVCIDKETRTRHKFSSHMSVKKSKGRLLVSTKEEKDGL